MAWHYTPSNGDAVQDAKTLAEARREVSHLNELVAQLSGHANSKQKIQRVMKIEQDNVALRR